MSYLTADPNEVSKAIITKYESLPRKGKPVLKSNGVKEWTVLAGIAALIQAETHNDDDVNEARPEKDHNISIDTLTITTGVKALPDDIVKNKSQGRLLHDCHAEILSIRAFNKFILSECRKVQEGIETSNYIEKEEEIIDCYQFRLKKGIRFCLYVSEPPCGDCSLSLVQDSSQEDWTEDKHTYKDIKLLNGVFRGREFYNIKGKVRTKPGRRDSPLTLSKSCCDKLALTQVKGLLNNISSQFVNPKGFKLSQLIVPESASPELQDITRSFHQRLDKAETFEPFEIFTTSKHASVERANPSQPPSNLSLIHIPSLNIHESIMNSMKEGYFNKKTYIRKGGESCLSRVKLFEDSQSFLGVSSELTYLDVKALNEKYLSLKESAFKELGAWCKTAIDDFQISV